MVKKIAACVVLGLVLGLIGGLVGALIGGNYLEDFIFINLRGYEATALLGVILGAISGGILGWVMSNDNKN